MRMRTALISDIHGNREALAACLAHIQRNPVDRIIFMGDVVGYGADPVWCLEAVMSHCEKGAVALLGNHDEAVFKAQPDMNAAALQAIEWTRTRMSDAHTAFLKEMPLLKEEGEILYVHASAAGPHTWPYVIHTRDADACMRYTTRRVTICGHVHRPQFFHAPDGRPIEAFTPPPGIGMPLLKGRRWVVVLGSTGQPRDGNPAAAYSVLDSETGKITMYRIPYDVESAARKIRAAGLPPRLADRLFTGS